MGHLAGLNLHPYQRTPMHERHLALGAEMMPSGLWHRPAFYGAPGERDAAIAAEALAVRKGVGLIDVSTLGKIEVMGPDAGKSSTPSMLPLMAASRSAARAMLCAATSADRSLMTG